ncbi:MAG: hypothetical protein E7610_03855 [Ruminococcaceae bacterium]|nr:hypothetical protein [Oscillospiraceae bacterium]
MMKYQGTYISGRGNADRLAIIDKSFAALHPCATLPNLPMLYRAKNDMLCEGFIWGSGWWIQNSYGFTMGAIPLFDELWLSRLQNSYDAFWNRIGDGKRLGADNGIPTQPIYALCAPDGSLGDCVLEPGIVYRQGDGHVDSYDWFYEATAAGVHMQADILLFDRRPEMLARYMPLMWRSLNHIESTRAENGLFLVGAASNLLAPSYGGSFNSETGEVGKGYLTGLLITYSAALKKCAELCRMMDDTAGEAACHARLQKNLDALPQLLTEEGYLAKSMDPDGTLHGVYGAKRYGYLEAVCNLDAIAWEVVAPDVARSIYRKIDAVPEIRGAGIICNNYPHLDDTLDSYRERTTAPHSLGWLSGDWVDGGCWATVEGRAILAYMKLGQHADAFRAADVYMRWAEEYRQDAPLSQWGHNQNNPWQKENADYSVCERPVSVMIDNFAPVTCLLRGLFQYAADAEGLWIIPSIPNDITELNQSHPVHFGGCRIYMRYHEEQNSPEDGTELTADACGRIFIPAELLPRGGAVTVTVGANGLSVLTPASTLASTAVTGDIEGLPVELTAVYRTCEAMLAEATDSERVGSIRAASAHTARIREVLLAAEAAALRRRLPFDKHELRPMTEDKIQKIIELYDKTVLELYEGLKS